MNKLPEWAVVEILNKGETPWRTIRADLRRRLGWNPSAEMMYNAINPTIETIAACGKPKRFVNFPRGYVFCGSLSDCPCAVESAKLNRNSTNLEKYGSDNYFVSERFVKKSKETCLKKYGVEHVAQSKEFQQRVKDYWLLNHGVEYSVQVPEVQAKSKSTTQERYGVDHALQSPTIFQKTKDTMLTKYGTVVPRHANIPDEIINLLSNPDKLKEKMKSHSFNSLAVELNVDSSTIGNYWRKHGFIAPQSSYENEIAGFLERHEILFEMNRKHQIAKISLDFFIPNHSIAIEFNGIWWHCTARQPELLYHRRKYESCRDAGIQLVMINEDEWLEHAGAVKSRLLNLMGKSQIGVGARSLNIQKISTTIANQFIDQHHIQGAAGSITYAAGAFYGGEIVGVMAFNKQRGTQDNELIRFCSDGGVYSGMFSRMLKHAIRENNYTNIISFADLRYSLGDVYRKNGFTLVDEIRPDYRYVYRRRTWHKSSFTKTKIAKKFDVDMSKLTEREAMDQLGIHRIYDCGKLKFVWEK